MSMNPASLVKLVFWAYDSTGATTTGTFEVVSLQVVKEVVENEPTPEPETELVTEDLVVTGFAQDSGDKYVFDATNKTIQCTYGTSMGKWARFNFDGLAENTVKVILKVKSTSDFALAAKLDNASNGYDGTANNKLYKKLTADEVITFEWDLVAMSMNPASLVKLVFWAYDSTGATTTGTFEVVSLQVVKEVVAE